MRVIKYGIYIPFRIYGKVCLSTSTVATFVVNLQLGIYTGLLTIITIIQIYRFISELSPIIAILQSENTYAAIVGDFNKKLLQISEREKFGDFFDWVCTNNFFPKISFPTRFARDSCILIDQIFYKTPHKKT